MEYETSPVGGPRAIMSASCSRTPAADDMQETDPETVRRLRSLGYVR